MRKFILLSVLFLLCTIIIAKNPGYLGILVNDYDNTMFKGVLVVNVFDDGAAKQYGLKENDIITSIDGKLIQKKSELVAEINNHSWGDLVTINLIRNQVNKNLQVYLGYKGTTRTYNVKKSILNNTEHWLFTDDNTEILVKPDNTPISISKVSTQGIKEEWIPDNNYILAEVPQYFLDINDKVACIKRIKEDQAKRNCKINDIIYIKDISEKNINTEQATPAEELNIKEFAVFPNPTNGKFTINVQSTDKGALQLTIFDITGKKIQSVSTVDFSGQFTEVFDISHEAKGVYLVQLIIGDKQTSKVVLHN